MNYYNEEFEKGILLDYQTLTGQEVAIKNGICVATLYKILNRHGVILNKKLKYKLNEDYFKNIDSKTKAYIFGLICADGTVKSNSNTFEITLKNNDEYILYAMSKEFENERPLTKRGVYTTLTITNKIFKQNLVNLGVIERKTHLLKFPTNLEKEYYSAFILGYFDGDGHIGRTKNIFRFSLVGNGDFIYSIKEIFSDIGVNCYIHKRHKERDNNILSINISGTNQIRKVCDYMYQNLPEFYFERKYEVYQDLVAWSNLSKRKK